MREQQGNAAPARARLLHRLHRDGPKLAVQARRNLAGFPVEIEVSPFETWEGERESFDLVFAATAWHWIDPAVHNAKAHRLLRPGGHLAFWSARHAFPPGFDPKPQPFGVSFTGMACSEPTLLKLAYAFEEATKKRTPPPGLR